MFSSQKIKPKKKKMKLYAHTSKFFFYASTSFFYYVNLLKVSHRYLKSQTLLYLSFLFLKKVSAIFIYFAILQLYMSIIFQFYVAYIHYIICHIFRNILSIIYKYLSMFEVRSHNQSYTYIYNEEGVFRFRALSNSGDSKLIFWNFYFINKFKNL